MACMLGSAQGAQNLAEWAKLEGKKELSPTGLRQDSLCQNSHLSCLCCLQSSAANLVL